MIVRQLKALLAKASDEDVVTFAFNGEAPIVTDAKIKYIRPDNTISDKKIKNGLRAFVFTTRLTPASAIKDIIKKRNETAKCVANVVAEANPTIGKKASKKTKK